MFSMRKQKVVAKVVMTKEIEFSTLPVSARFRINNGCQCDFVKVSASSGKVTAAPAGKPQYLNMVKPIPPSTVVIPL